MASETTLPTPGPGFGSVVLHHLPDSVAPSFMAAMLVYAFCLGMVTLEIIGNISYDWFLVRRAGWLNPVKLSNRLAYFLARFGSWTFLFLTLLYMTLPGLHCSSFAISLNCLWLCPLIMVDYIFLQRTLALYSWAKLPTILLFFLYIVEVGLGVGNVVWFGIGYQLPESNFCAYLTETDKQPHSSIFIAYYCIVIITDTIILCMTAHRLTAGGIRGVPRAIRQKWHSIRKGEDSLFDENISSLLIAQGVHYYLLLEFARVIFLIVYYSVAGTTSYQVLVLAILAAIAPLLAGRLFRKTSEVAQRVARSQNSGERGAGSAGGRGTLSNPLVTPTATTFSQRRSMAAVSDRFNDSSDPYSPFSHNATAPVSSAAIALPPSSSSNPGIGILPSTQMDAHSAIAAWRGHSNGNTFGISSGGEDDLIDEEKRRIHGHDYAAAHGHGGAGGHLPRYRTWKTSGSSQPSSPAAMIDMINYPPHSPSATLIADTMTPRIDKVVASPRTFGATRDSLDEDDVEMNGKDAKVVEGGEAGREGEGGGDITSYLDAASTNSSSEGRFSFPPSPGASQQVQHQQHNAALYPPSPPAVASPTHEGRRRVEWAWPSGNTHLTSNEQNDDSNAHPSLF